ncbi:NAD(P)-dependent dehydrogenase (short-subunit alcohol dehydrogenase family) [Kribbella orskensis]|uniref:NAD(P)-dependent dehydrogenase (Short-subunit alcohol dehydrogenase family) n=1 Tax=Kribbella orskensis TaxID=2512216 RepID=A0ABY2BSP4_9ACTN|nr:MULTISPECIES: SDR family NAD(P)-dependent oxidoreductase [Kribbella]TCN43032.1 NAD(P)-dependent dehydrogenase (short-subunit alcohol dehydrogenase family) [Kribbella sp. VKM Ac-2500]TCO29612.1 NAD(P)-dependent dehydrogenase (short-subunit alcohol dehydrogenase family) [Kribbella orskensis]
MSRILITGSADGLGLMAAERLLDEGHEVVLHARNESRARDARATLPGASGVLTGDVSSIAETKDLARQANESGRFDVVIHNVAVGYREPRIETADGLEHVFAINVLAPYLLTALIDRPSRLVYLSSGMHLGGDLALDDLQWVRRRWNGSQAYSDSKLYDVILAFAVARLWPSVSSNAVDPGWVATKMGGAGAPGDLTQGPETQVWLATTPDPPTGGYFYHLRPYRHDRAAADPKVQTGFLNACQELTGVELTA